MKYRVITEFPVAFDSIDHLVPHGTAHDNSRNPRFNQKLYRLGTNEKLRVVDLGCSGGGFVKDLLDDGHDAIGIEGSDFSKKIKRAEWATIPDNLFTADITRPFDIEEDDENTCYFDGTHPIAQFDVATAWEVMEHLPAERMGTVIDNVLRHLSPNGLWIMSVSTQQGEHHVCIEHRNWWLKLFDAHGLKNNEDLVHYFGNDWIRGPLQNAPESFHLILSRK